MKVPYTNFKTRTGDDTAIGGCGFIGGEWKEIDTPMIFDGKKVVVFALPGAFTPTCSSQQLPGFENNYDLMKKFSIDEIYCVSVNDSYVMNAWAKQMGITKVKLIPDGSGNFTRFMGMLIGKNHLGFGMRSWRYMAVVNNGVVEKWFQEPGINNHMCLISQRSKTTTVV